MVTSHTEFHSHTQWDFTQCKPGAQLKASKVQMNFTLIIITQPLLAVLNLQFMLPLRITIYNRIKLYHSQTFN